MAKGTALHRALAFFRDEADEDIVRLALERATEIVAERGMRGRGKTAKGAPRKTKATPAAQTENAVTAV